MELQCSATFIPSAWSSYVSILYYPQLHQILVFKNLNTCSLCFVPFGTYYINTGKSYKAASIIYNLRPHHSIRLLNLIHVKLSSAHKESIAYIRSVPHIRVYMEPMRTVGTRNYNYKQKKSRLEGFLFAHGASHKIIHICVVNS